MSLQYDPGDEGKQPISNLDPVSTPEEVAETENIDIADPTSVDDTLAFMKEWDPQVRELSPEEDRRLGRKVVSRILSLTFLVNLVLYMDKATLSYSAISGLWEHTGLNQDTYNDCNTLFYVGFFVGQIPSIWLIQHLPLSKLLVGVCFFWTVLVFLICAAYNFPGVLMLRFFLGVVESPAINILTTSNGQFMTKNERAATQPIFYAACMFSPIPIGFIAYGTFFAHTTFGDYRVLNIIIGGLSLIVTVLLWFLYPDNPTNARFLTNDERVWVVRRVHRTQHNTIQQSKFKYPHAIEAIKDPISWLISGFFLLQQLANNLTYQQTILYNNMGGISNLDSTLITVAGAGYAVVWAILAAIAMFLFPNTTCLTLIWSLLPSWVGSVVAISLPYTNTIGILAGICLASQSFGVAWICAFGLASSTAGSSYTKRLVRNAMALGSYSISNIISPQLWQDKDGPRFLPAWVVQIVLSFSVAPGLIGIVWFVLARRNRQRKKENSHKIGLIDDEDGNKRAVDMAILDLTDLEDKTFIYPL